MAKRAGRKANTEAQHEGLAELASPLHRTYVRALGCAANLNHVGGTVTAKYCKTRFCAVCNAIRTAQLIDAYGPEIRTWADRHFVTLTRPNVRGPQLHGEVRDLKRTLNRLFAQIRRTDGLRWKAVQKTEVTYNVTRHDYHPHFHLIVDSAAVAHKIVARWLAMNPRATPTAQHIRRANEQQIRDLLKYQTKQVTKIDGKHTGVPAYALDQIARATRRLQMVKPMGFTVSTRTEALGTDEGELETTEGTHAKYTASTPQSFRWNREALDWINHETGELYHEHELTAKQHRLVANIRAQAHTANADQSRAFARDEALAASDETSDAASAFNEPIPPTANRNISRAHPTYIQAEKHTGNSPPHAREIRIPHARATKRHIPRQKQPTIQPTSPK